MLNQVINSANNQTLQKQSCQNVTDRHFEIEDQIDMGFIQQVVNEVTVSCALPVTIPIERVPQFILQGCRYFWQNDDQAVENKIYIIPYSAFCQKTGSFNKEIKLPPQIASIQGVYKSRQGVTSSVMGDFSISRMVMSTYQSFGGVGNIGSGVVNGTGSYTGTSYALQDVVTSLYEVDTFQQALNPTVTFHYNQFSNILNLMGDVSNSENIVIDCWQKIKPQDLYKNYYFFRFVVALIKRSLSTVLGTYEFKLAGGVAINTSKFVDEANKELEDIEQYLKDNHSTDYFFQPNTL